MSPFQSRAQKPEVTISATRLRDYLDPDIEVKVAHADGAHWRTLKCDGIKALAAEAAITGRGSASRLKYCVLECTAEEAEAILGDHALANSTTPGARLTRSQPSQSVVRNTIPPDEASRTSHAFVTYSHVGQRRYRPQDRELPAVVMA